MEVAWRFVLACALSALCMMPACTLAAGEDDPQIKLLITVRPQAAATTASAEVTGGQAPYHYRWALGEDVNGAPFGGDTAAIEGVALRPFNRTLIWCKVTDALGHTGRAFRHVLPPPPGERTGAIRFFGIGDSIENAGGAADAEHPAVIAVAAQLCEKALGLPAGGIPWQRCSYPGYTSAEIAKNMPAILEQARKFGATDAFIRMGLNDGSHAAPTSAATTLAVARAVKDGCPSIQRVWLEPCTARAEGDDRLWKMAQACQAAEETPWLYYTCDAAHWHQRRAPNLYPDETHPGPDANRALGICRAAAWIVKGPPSHPGIGLPPR